MVNYTEPTPMNPESCTETSESCKPQVEVLTPMVDALLDEIESWETPDHEEAFGLMLERARVMEVVCQTLMSAAFVMFERSVPADEQDHDPDSEYQLARAMFARIAGISIDSPNE